MPKLSRDVMKFFGWWKKKKEEGAQFEQTFDFENGPVQLGEGTFQPLRDAVHSWPCMAKTAFGTSDGSVEIVYELRDGRWVLMKYDGSRLIVVRLAEGNREVWRTPAPAVGKEIVPLEALRWFTRQKIAIPASLEPVMADLAAHQKDPPRDLAHWIGKGYTDNKLRSAPPDQQLAVPIAQEILDDVIRVVQSLRVGSGSRFLKGPRLIPLFTRFAVDPQAWWGPPNEIPPQRAGILDIPWCPGAEPIRTALQGLHDILEGPMAIARLADSQDHPDHPTQAEQDAADRFLIDSLPRLETLTIDLKAALAQFEAQGAQQTHTLAGAKLSLPSDGAVRIYLLHAMTGKNQTEVASLYTAGSGIPMTQGQVSKAINEVIDWIAAGNKLPEIQLPPPRPVQAVDPKVLDMGANREGRTKRQRGKRDGD